jgi:hypothetical protein
VIDRNRVAVIGFGAVRLTLTPLFDGPAADGEQAGSQGEAAEVSLSDMSADERASWRLTGEAPKREQKPAAQVEQPQAADDDGEDDGEQQGQPQPAQPAQQPQQHGRPPVPGSNRSKIRALETQIAELKAAIAQSLPAAQPAASAQPQQAAAEFKFEKAKPVQGDFDVYEDFIDALTDWKIEHRDAKAAFEVEQRQAAERQQSQQRAVHERFGAFAQRRDAFAQSEPARFEKIIPFLDAVPANTPLYDTLIDSDVFAPLAEYLMNNPDEIARLDRLDFLGQLRELGKLEAKVSPQAARPASAAPAPAKTVTSAPAPPPTLGSRPAEPANEIDAAVAGGDFRRYAAAANARDLSRGR